MVSQIFPSSQFYLVALGANQPSAAGDPRETVEAALKALRIERITLIATSRLFRTPAFPAGSGPDFVNSVIKVAFDGGPEDLLSALHRIEAGFGRTRDHRWGARTLDLDLVAGQDMVLPDEQTHQMWRDLPLEQQQARSPDRLILPHPRLQDRAFVLVPLCDVAPDWVHPILNKTVAQMREDLPQQALREVRPL